MKKVVLLVTGGRDFYDEDLVAAAMGLVVEKYQVVHMIHGGAAGADTLAGREAERRGVGSLRVCKPDWERFGKRAGYLRNSEMVSRAMSMRSQLRGRGESVSVLCLAFPGGAGTAHMVNQCEAAGIKVLNAVAEVEKAEVAKGLASALKTPFRLTYGGDKV